MGGVDRHRRDLRGLKHINDTQGHPAGDALLQRVATIGIAVFPGGRRPRRTGQAVGVTEEPLAQLR